MGPNEMPSSRWELPAPESHVLLAGVKGSGKQAMKLALLELVARRLLAIVTVEESGRLRTSRTAVLVPGAARSQPTARSLQALLELYAQASPRTYKDGTTGVAVAELATAARKRYRTLGGYVETEVLPELARLGLYAREEYKRLGLFRATRWVRTPEGEAARADLQGRMAAGQGVFGRWVSEDPSRALAYVALAGSSVLLMSDLHPELQRLREQQRAQAGGETAAYSSGDLGDESEREPSSEELDTGELDVGGADFGGLDLQAFDGFDAIDSGVDSGGDSGGDGGGDGGGGGD